MNSVPAFVILSACVAVVVLIPIKRLKHLLFVAQREQWTLIRENHFLIMLKEGYCDSALDQTPESFGYKLLLPLIGDLRGINV